jgi:competence protein ComEA
MKKLILLLTIFSFNAFAAKVNVNIADAQSISEALSGVGLKKAEAIIKHRKTEGAFKSLDDFVMVKGIGPKIVEQNKQDILFK